MAKSSPPMSHPISPPSSISTKNTKLELQLHDAPWCFKTLEFLGNHFYSSLPLCFSGDSFSITMKVENKSKKYTTAQLLYDSRELPDYQLYGESDPDEVVRLHSGDEKLYFGVDISIIKECFKEFFSKSTQKPSTDIKVYSKINDNNLFFSKNKNAGEFTLKTLVGYSPPEAEEPNLKWINDHEISHTSITVEAFVDFCSNIKSRFSDCDIIMSICRRGVRIRATEHGNKDKTAVFTYGIIDSIITTMTVEAKFFVEFSGYIDKMCHVKSIMYIKFSREDAKTDPTLTLLFKIGNAGRLIYHRT